MANLITVSRLPLLFLLVWLAYVGAPAWKLALAPMVLFIFILDAIDGWVARRRGESSVFGAVIDIAVDRVVENVLWVVLAHLGLVPVWVPLLFLTRGILVDSLRSKGVASGVTPFAMMRTPLGQWLVAGRPMRLVYGVVKATAFTWLLLLLPLPEVAPVLWAAWGGVMQGVGTALVNASVALCLLRGLPVLVESAFAEAQQVRKVRPSHHAH